MSAASSRFALLQRSKATAAASCRTKRGRSSARMRRRPRLHCSTGACAPSRLATVARRAGQGRSRIAQPKSPPSASPPMKPRAPRLTSSTMRANRSRPDRPACRHRRRRRRPREHRFSAASLRRVDRAAARAGAELDDEFQAAAGRHLVLAERVLSRMHSGLELVRSDERCRRAFELANHAMLLQQLRTAPEEPARDALQRRLAAIEIVEPLVVPDWRDVKDRGDWRPFQIAFVLMALGSTASRGVAGAGDGGAHLLPDRRRQDRSVSVPCSVLDVLPAGWPTRGCWRRCTHAVHATAADGTAIPAGWRADLRDGAPPRPRADDLGAQRFTIGIWVGGAVTPNNRGEARTVLRKLQRGIATPRTSSSCCAAPGVRRRWERSRASAKSAQRASRRGLRRARSHCRPLLPG